MKPYILKQKGLLAITILCGTIFSIGSTLVALILKDVIDVAMTQDRERFTQMVLQTIIYLLILGLCYWGYATVSKKFVCKVAKILRGDVFGGIFAKNISDFRSVNSADYLSALTNDMKNVEENYLNPLLLCVQNILVFITSFAIMLYLSPLVTFCLFVAMFLLVVLPSLFQKSMQCRQDDFSKNQSGFTVGVKDFLWRFIR